jgi:hypothetical protein
VYREQTVPLMRYYRKELVTIDEVGAIDGVFARVLGAVTAITTDPQPAGSSAMTEIRGNARVNTEARSTTDSWMTASAKQIAPRHNVTCPAHHLGLGMA